MFAIHLMSSICSLLLLTSTVWAAAEISPVHFDTVELPTLQHAKRVGSVNPHQVITFTVWLKLRNKEHLNSFINELYEPHSTRHQKFLTKEEHAANYAPSAHAVHEVENYFIAQGMKTERVYTTQQYLAPAYLFV